LLEAAGRTDEKETQALVADPKDVTSSYGPWWAIRGRFARLRGDDKTADSSFIEAVAADPLDVEAACEGLLPTSRPANPGGRTLCEGAQSSGEPGIGQD
jgi:hypothetical protein